MTIPDSSCLGHIDRLYRRYPKLTNYLVIGGTAAAVDILVFAGLFNLLGFSAVGANLLSVSIATVESYTLNALYNFRTRDHVLFRFASFIAVSALGLAVGTSLIYVLHNLLGLDGNLAKISVMPVVVTIQYLLNKHVSFRQ